ncbi:PDZ domain-containing protein, partial [Salmonella enterica subsp. enterica serovar 1,4,[5],12:i:-]
LTKVYPDHPAERAGLKVGDRIIEFQGVAVTDLKQLTELIGQEPPGKPVKLQYVRDGENHDLTLRLAMRWD